MNYDIDKIIDDYYHDAEMPNYSARTIWNTQLKNYFKACTTTEDL